MAEKNPYGILVREKNHHAIPFSRGILAGSISEIGFDIFKAYNIAEDVLTKLRQDEKDIVDSSRIREMVTREIRKVDARAARRYRLWRDEKERKKRGEAVILIGGSSGVGTTTIAYEIGNRLNIKTIVNTDIIREVMRKTISEELNPELHCSTFNAYESCSIPVPDDYDPVIFGFERQAMLVTVGVEAVIHRALTEGHDIIVEGVHLIPGYLYGDIMDRERTFTFMLGIKEKEVHSQRFTLRSHESDLRRPSEHYLRYFKEIRTIQEYLKGKAYAFKVPCMENNDVDYTVELIMQSIFGEK